MIQTNPSVPPVKEILMTVTSKGQVTLPADVRRFLRIEKHQKIALVLEADRSVKLKLPSYPSVSSLRGAAGKLSKSLTWKHMRETARADTLLEIYQ